MKYDFELDPSLANDSLAIIARKILPKSTVLEFGCANGRLTKYLKNELNCKVYALEIDSDAARDAMNYADKLIIGDIEKIDWQKQIADTVFDYIVFADVLEHLYSPESILSGAKQFLKPDGSILISIPNVAHNAIIMGLLHDEFTYQQVGILDDTHIRFFTKKNIDTLIERCGLEIQYETFTTAPPLVHDFTLSYEDLDEDMASYLKKRPLGEAYQFILELKRSCNNPIFDLNDNATATLYYDTGTGFNESNSQKVIYNPNQESNFTFSIPIGKNIKAIRFDPAEDFIQFELYSFTINGKSKLANIDHNGHQSENNYKFLTNDPQLIFNCDLDIPPTQVEISISKIMFITRKFSELQNEKKSLEKNLQLKIAETQQLENEISQLHLSLRSLQEKVAHLEHYANSLLLRQRIKAITKQVLPRQFSQFISARVLQPYRKYKTGKVGYQFKVEKFSKHHALAIKNFACKPLISILMPVFNTEPTLLEKAILSVQSQWYEAWELCIVDDCSTSEDTIAFLKTIDDPKIKIILSPENQHISRASNQAAAISTGSYIGLMDHDDTLAPNALFEIVTAINEKNPDFIYSDEDKINHLGQYEQPHFKPDFSHTQLLSQNYISHFSVFKKTLFDQIEGFREGFEGAQDFDLYLRMFEQTNNIHHIPKVLYHWRKTPGSTADVFEAKSYAQENGKKAVAECLSRRGIDSEVTNGLTSGTYRIHYNNLPKPLVSIIIPFKDQPNLLSTCLESILSLSSYKNFEIIGISNNSSEPKTIETMRLFEERDKRISFFHYNIPFNYSSINNYAVNKYANGEHIILLNNDIEIISNNWMEELLAHSLKKDVACVGGKLYYPNDTIQHAGVIVGLGGVAGHSHKHFDRMNPGYFSRLSIPQNVSAVTGACLMIKKSIFEELHGLNEDHLAVAFNDVDLCLRATELGYQNIFTPYCEAYHHESISRGYEDTPEKRMRFEKEAKYFKQRHAKFLADGDPFYNPNLTLVNENFSLR